MRIRSFAPSLLVSCALVCAPALVAQSSGSATLEGEVVDSVSGRPIEGVLVRMDSGPQTFSDDEGRFRIADLTPGAHTVALMTSDCRVTWSDVLLASGEVTRTTVRMTAPPELAADEERRDEERRRAEGKLVTAAEIERMNARSMTDVLRRVEPSMIGGLAGYTGTPARVIGRSRNALDAADGGTEPVVVIDGVRAAHGSQALATLRPEDVATMEILAGAAAGWAYGSAGSSGIIRIVTRKGSEPSAGAERSAPCNVSGFPGR